MAQAKKDPPPTDSPEAAPPKKKGKLLMILIALLVLGGGGGGAAWYFLGHGKSEGHEQVKAEPEKPPIFTRLDTFTVNLLRGSDEDHFLQTDIELQVADNKVIDEIKLRMPQIRNAMLLLLSSKTADDLATVEGKQKLAADIVAQINKIIGIKEEKSEPKTEPKPEGAHETKAQKPKSGVLGVFFSSFVIQ